MSVLERPYGRIEIVKGLTPNGEKIYLKNFIPKKSRPPQMTVSRLEFQSHRASQVRDLPESVDAFFISRVEAWSKQVGNRIVWAAGLQTWKKLAALGVWVHGSSEGLGESEDSRLEILSGEKLRWATLGHEERGEQRLATYRLDLKLHSKKLNDSAGYSWKSGSEFQLALSQFPELRNKAHFCGPGRTFQIIKKELGSDQNIFVELSDEFITVI
jgi:hydroxymethylbilane synthase